MTIFHVMKHPGLGSGKIKRRVEISLLSKPRRKRPKQQGEERLNRPIAGSKKSNIADNRLAFKSVAVKQIFQFWNRQGFPFTMHRPIRSKITERCISVLDTHINKYETRQLIDAIEVGYRVFSSNHFIFRFMYRTTKISLPAFFRFSLDEKKMFESWHGIKAVKKIHGIDLPDSWFKECLKGWSYVNKTYCIYNKVKDDNPEATKQAIDMIEKHRQRPLNDKGKRDIVKFVKMLFKFGEINSLDPWWLLEHIGTALNTFHTVKIDRTHYLTSDIFWSDTLPNELIRFDKRGFEGRKFISDKEQLLK